MREPARRARIVGILVVFAAVACSPQSGRPPTAGEPTLTPTVAVVPPTARPTFWIEAPVAGDPSPIFARTPATGVVVEAHRVRLPPPRVASGPRRVGIQAGHWRTAEAPSEFPRLRTSIGGSFGELREVDVTLDVARRITVLLGERGVIADLIPATIPPSYVADAFVAIHADADETATARGFKIAHGTYRSPHDARLVRSLTEHYGTATGLPWDPHVTDDMTDYYAFAWFRYEHALAPHTAAAIVELGFISHPDDRALLTERQDVVARGIVEGILASSTPSRGRCSSRTISSCRPSRRRARRHPHRRPGRSSRPRHRQCSAMLQRTLVCGGDACGSRGTSGCSRSRST